MTDVTIEYCVPCGFRDRAIELQRAILAALESDLDGVALVTGEHGVFRVSVDGEPVFDDAPDAADVDAIVRDVRERL